MWCGSFVAPNLPLPYRVQTEREDHSIDTAIEIEIGTAKAMGRQVKLYLKPESSGERGYPRFGQVRRVQQGPRRSFEELWVDVEKRIRCTVVDPRLSTVNCSSQQDRLSGFNLFQIKFLLLSIIGPRQWQLEIAEGDEGFFFSSLFGGQRKLWRHPQYSDRIF